jgi:hypothetical protein
VRSYIDLTVDEDDPRTVHGDFSTVTTTTTRFTLRREEEE